MKTQLIGIWQLDLFIKGDSVLIYLFDEMMDTIFTLVPIAN